MKSLYILLCLSMMVHAYSQLDSLTNITNPNSVLYHVRYHTLQPIGIELGVMASQTNGASADVTAPLVGIRYTVLPTPRFAAYVAVGTGISFTTQNETPQRYITRYVTLGSHYRLGKRLRLVTDYTHFFGRLTHQGQTHSLHSGTLLMGASVLLTSEPTSFPPTSPTIPSSIQKNHPTPNTKTPQKSPQPSMPSPYQQTQQLMRELSWPTY
jgi:hypothetical protein